MASVRPDLALTTPMADRPIVVAGAQPSTGRGILASVSTMDFDTLFKLEYASMVALARAICGDHEQAEHLAQEAFSRAHKHWVKVSGYERPGAWVRRVTINPPSPGGGASNGT